MINLNLNNLAVLMGARVLFCDVDLQLSTKNRYGIIGANGAGKSTLLKIISGDEEPSAGEVVFPKSATIAGLKQDQFKYENELIINVVIQGKEQLWDAMQQKEEILKCDHLSPEQGMQLAELEEIVAHLQGYTAEAAASKLLIGLGIAENKHFDPLSSLSGGYKLRVLLAKVLFQNPDILLLDEPTNHLDLMTTYWLESYLKEEYKGLLVLVSHDVEFMNNVSTRILDIDYGEIREYGGNYKFYLNKKEEVIEQKKQAAVGATKKIAQLQKFIDTFGAKATKAKQAKSKEKQIQKIEVPDVEKSSRISPRFVFDQSIKSGKKVLKAKKISKKFAEKQVLSNISFEVNRQDKLVVIGHNGIGKSTLLKIILGKLDKDNGEYEWGHEIKLSYFSQDHHELINQKISVLQWAESHAPANMTSSDVRKILGRALFSSDDVHKGILSLSGGEVARLILAKIMMEKSNVLILDEPTNHMDIEAIDALIQALQSYEGTLIFVSHDRYFAEKIANRVLAITESGIKNYPGSYSEFIKDCGSDYLNQDFVKSISNV